jgi:hypothetical protein
MVKQELDKLNSIGLIFDGYLRGSVGAFPIDSVSDKGGLAAIPRSQNQKCEGGIEI